jgi:GAF domain-containing protein
VPGDDQRTQIGLRRAQIVGASFFAILTGLDSVANAAPIPHPDGLGLISAALFFACLFAPNIASLRVSGESVEVTLREALATAVESTAGLDDAVEALDGVTDLLQDWTATVNWLNRHLQLASTTDEDAIRAVIRYCRERMADVREMIGDDDEAVRLSVWWYSEAKEGLVLIASDDIHDDETKAFVFHRGEGILGQAFAEGRYWNLKDALAEPGYVKIRTVPPKYRGLLCMPIHFGGNDLIGMVSVDRTKAETFDDGDVAIVQALSDILAFALTLPRFRQQYGVLPDAVAAALSGEPPLRALPETSEGGERST